MSFITYLNIASVAIAILLILLLVIRETLQAYGSPRALKFARQLFYYIIPLFIIFGVVILLRVLAGLEMI